MIEAEIIAALRTLPREARARVLAIFGVGKARDEFGLTKTERDYAEAFLLFEASGLDAALSKLPAERRSTFERAAQDPHYHTDIRTNAKKIKASRISNARRLVESNPIETD